MTLPASGEKRHLDLRARRGLQAFTLIELMISAALMSLIIVSSYLCLHAALATQKLIEPRVETLQTARVVLSLMAADLRCACSLSADSDLVGTHRISGDMESDSIDFATHNYTPRRAREGDFCQESFFLDKDPRSGQMGLWRRRNPRITRDPFSEGAREQLAKGVAGLRLEYFDGLDWYDSWGDEDRRNKQQFSLKNQPNLVGLPQAVRITLLLSPNLRKKSVPDQETTTNEPPLVFQTVACLNLANAQLPGPSSGTETNSAPAQPGSDQTTGPAPVMNQ
jgi:prepilin-type N-terminal cleavage/methylation domain-containing protein